MSAPILSIRDVSVSFKGVKALTSLSFDVAEGEICALIGPNGAGKSTLLNVLSGVYHAQEGELRVAGEPVPRPTPRRAAELGVARTFQNNALFRDLSVLDNVLAGLSRFGAVGLVAHAFRLASAVREEAAFRDRAEAAIAFVELEAWRDAPVGLLPYGVQKRVEIARALAAGPRVLLLDEPMAGMNQAEKAEISRLILDVNRDLGATVVLIEHDIGVVMGLSHHVVVLDYGRKVGDGAPAEVRANPEVIAAYLGVKH